MNPWDSFVNLFSPDMKKRVVQKKQAVDALELKYDVRVANDEVPYYVSLGLPEDIAIVLSRQDEATVDSFFDADPESQYYWIEQQKQELYNINHPAEAEAYAASQRSQSAGMREAEAARLKDIDRKRAADPALAARIDPWGALTDVGRAQLVAERATAAAKKHLPIIILAGVGVGAFVLLRRRKA